MLTDPLQLVVDANILVSAFLKAATTRRLLLDERLELHSPAYLLSETQKVLKSRLAKRWQLPPGFDFDQLFSTLTSGIQVVDQNDYDSFMRQALEIAPHDEDAPYLACSLHLNIPLWSNDAGMKEQKFVKVFTTEELLEEMKKEH